MMWVFVGIACIELVVVHTLLWFWSKPVAFILSVVTLASIVWLLRVIWSMKRLPILLDERRLVMRVGTLRSVEVAVEDIAGLRPTWDAAALKDRSVLNFALIAYPNVVIDLARPMPGRRGIVAIAHRVDDRAAFVRAIEALGGMRDR